MSIEHILLNFGMSVSTDFPDFEYFLQLPTFYNLLFDLEKVSTTSILVSTTSFLILEKSLERKLQKIHNESCRKSIIFKRNLNFLACGASKNTLQITMLEHKNKKSPATGISPLTLHYMERNEQTPLWSSHLRTPQKWILGSRRCSKNVTVRP